MKILALGGKLEYVERLELLEKGRSAVFISNSENAREAMEAAGIVYEGDINLEEAEFCRIETQQECLSGSLCIPKLLDVLEGRYRLLFFINSHHIVIIDDTNFSERLVQRIQKRKTQQGETREHFIYNFFAQFMSKDLQLLLKYERVIMGMEEDVMAGEIEEFQNEIVPIRKELLTLRSYYDEIMDMGKELEEDENSFFADDQLKFFGTIADRADRLMSKTAHLLEYAQQVQDAYQAQLDAEQNRTMQFLTTISTIFFPLTLITSWYGMNFKNMPELQNGYPGVILLSLAVLVVCIVIFKKKKML